jgi:nucleotide-binding universal stress UspA family protein
MFKKLLIAVDDSSCSVHAGEYALELAKRFNAQVCITTIVEELPKVYKGGDWAQALVEQGEQLLDEWSKKGEARGLPFDRFVVTGTVTGRGVAESILHMAREHNCDLIVMGTHGRKGIAHVLGSIAERVIRLATMPVMLVREAKDTLSPNWQRILVAVDGSDASRKALRYADHLAQTASAELHLIHVIPDLPPPLVDPIGVGGVAASFTYSDTLKQFEHDARIIMEVSRAEIDTQNTVFHTARAQRERIADTLVRYAQEQSCALIVMGTHGRTGFNRFLLGSVAEGVAHTTTVPLLLIRKDS